MPEADILEHVKVPNRDWSKERLIANYGRCDRLRQLFHQKKDTILREVVFEDARSRLLAEFGGGEWESTTLIMAGDPLRSYRGHGLPLPHGISTSLADTLDWCGHRLVDEVQGHSDVETLRLSAGLFLREMDEKFKEAVNGSSLLRLRVLSAHDVTVGTLLLALEIPSHRWPGFGSSVHVELVRSKSSGQWYVRATFFDGVPPADGAPTASKVMTLQAWEKRIGPLSLSEDSYIQRCKLPMGVPEPPAANF